MTLLALWLAMLGIADLVRWRADASLPRQLLGGGSAAAGAVGAVGLGGLDLGEGLLAVTGLTALTAIWLGSSWWALHARGPAWLPLGTLATGMLALAGASGGTPVLGERLQRWYDGLPVPAADTMPFDRFAIVVGGLLFLQATANLVVRLVLDSAGSPAEESEGTLKGGRILGPMERTFIFALGIAGELTAAAIIVAAKGLLRFPELQRDKGSRVDALTEYFLVGSLTSWLLAVILLPLT
jgi:hypothetical protein